LVTQVTVRFRMKLFIIFGLLVFIASCANVDPLDGLTEQQAFQRLIKTYKKVYASEKEYEHRFGIFKDNLKIIAELNAKDAEAIYGINEFADMSAEEFTERYRIQNFSSIESLTGEPVGPMDRPSVPGPNVTALPASYDWNSKGCVTAVYNQGTCGSCWAFASAENMESAACIAKKGLRNFSMQQLLDCVSNGSCRGGYPSSALQYAAGSGIMLYNSYPYTGAKGTCRYSGGAVAQRFSGWKYVDRSKNENNIQNWVYSSGAPAVCVDSKTWQYYQGGVVTSNCGVAIDHVVQITGWTTMNGRLAWKVRNSWGAGWGSAGYMYIAIGYNLCAVATEVLSAY